jgi:aspartate ammonia-lyase
LPNFRSETDLIGEVQVPADALYGIHTVRALENFPLMKRPPHPQLIQSFGAVKLACCQTNRAIGAWADEPDKGDAIERAASELREGLLDEHILVDVLQGGAGTSLNMNVNEVLANRAIQLLGGQPGDYSRVSPLNDVNRHQSTNDTYPTALKLAVIRQVQRLEGRIVELQEAFQDKEREFADVIKIGRTQFQDAVVTTLGREMGAYAEALNRDRWRVYKCEERLRVVNLGGTAIGTGLAAPRQYVFRVVDTLRELTGIGFARAENLVDATQNVDVFAEVSGILTAHASSLLKICTDLRIMSSGPEAGFGEIRLPQRQAGSSIMPGKVNPVIPEAASQAAMLALGNHTAITQAVSMGTLELNPFLPLIAEQLLESVDTLASANHILRKHCVAGIEANVERCREKVYNSTALLTALVPELGYDQASSLAHDAVAAGTTVRALALERGLITEKRLAELLSPEAVSRLGAPRPGAQ